MANRCMKGCSMALVIREMQIKTTMRHHLTPVRIGIINKSKIKKCWWECGERRTLLHCWWEATAESSTQIPQKVKNRSAFWPSYPTSSNISKGNQNTNWKNTNTSMFIASLFTIAKIWKQPKCPSIDEWIKQLWVFYTMELYSAIKKEKTLPFATV